MSIDNNKNFSNFIPENQATNINSPRAEADVRHLAADWKTWPDDSPMNLDASTSAPISNTPNNMNMDVDDSSYQGGMTDDEFFAAIRHAVGLDGLFVPVFIIKRAHENIENMEPGDSGDTQPRPIKTPRSRKLIAQTHQNRKRNEQEREM